ncbi:MAG: PASTA domain-containing protein [candidate division WOR-3 bacterium]
MIIFFVGFFIGFAVIGLFFMPMLSRPARDVKVPNVIGLRFSVAETIIKNSGLVIGSIDSTFDASVPIGCVIKQKPQPEKYVKTGRRVYLLVSKGPPRVRIPSAENTYLDKYLEVLRRLGFQNISVETLRSYEIPEGKIISVNPEPYSECQITDLLKIYVSGGIQGAFIMPRLIGLKIDEAINIIITNNLILQEIIELPSEEDPGIVIIQYPEEGMRVRTGDQVILTVSKGR